MPPEAPVTSATRPGVVSDITPPLYERRVHIITFVDDASICQAVPRTREVTVRESGERTRRGRGRRPAAEVRAGILAAAGRLLLAEGMGAFTIERVAVEAGASKTTIYKWWPSKGALALDGYFHAVESTLAFPDTGDIGADLTTQVRAFARLITETPAGRVIAELIGQAQTDPDLA